MAGGCHASDRTHCGDVPAMASCLHGLSADVQALRASSIAYRALTLLLALIALAFALTRGIYPLGGHDYYSHYFPYLTEVLRQQSLQPNEVWQHFYVSKGLTLYFFAMILTDPLAPALVTTALVGMGSWIVVVLLRRATASKFLPLAGGMLFIIFFVIGNDDLEKQHDVTAFLLLGAVWISIRLLSDSVSNRRLWIVALHCAVAVAILITLPLGGLVGLYMAGFAVFHALRRQWTHAIIAVGVCVTAAVCILSVATINYAYTGLPYDQGMLYFWSYADLNKILKWQMLSEVTMTVGTFASIVSAEQPLSWKLAGIFADYLRFTLWWPLAAAALRLIILRMRSASALRVAKRQIMHRLWRRCYGSPHRFW